MRVALAYVVAVGLWACGPGAARPAYTAVPASAPPPLVVLRVHDASLATLGVPPLATSSLPSGIRELRLSRGHGMVAGAEYPLVRLMVTPAGTTGEVIRFAVRARNGRVLDGPGRWVARRATPTTPVAWGRLLAHLDSLGVDSLVPPIYTTAVSDAGDLVVEVRRGAAYRAYAVNAPALRADSVGQRAAAIAQVVDSLDRLTRGY